MKNVCFRVIHPVKYYRDFLNHEIRPDGRELDQFRPIVLNVNSIGTSDGSAIVKIGKTTVVCGIKAVRFIFICFKLTIFNLHSKYRNFPIQSPPNRTTDLLCQISNYRRCVRRNSDRELRPTRLKSKAGFWPIFWSIRIVLTSRICALSMTYWFGCCIAILCALIMMDVSWMLHLLHSWLLWEIVITSFFIIKY